MNCILKILWKRYGPISYRVVKCIQNISTNLKDCSHIGSQTIGYRDCITTFKATWTEKLNGSEANWIDTDCHIVSLRGFKTDEQNSFDDNIWYKLKITADNK